MKQWNQVLFAQLAIIQTREILIGTSRIEEVPPKTTGVETFLKSNLMF